MYYIHCCDINGVQKINFLVLLEFFLHSVKTFTWAPLTALTTNIRYGGTDPLKSFVCLCNIRQCAVCSCAPYATCPASSLTRQVCPLLMQPSQTSLADRQLQPTSTKHQLFHQYLAVLPVVGLVFQYSTGIPDTNHLLPSKARAERVHRTVTSCAHTGRGFGKVLNSEKFHSIDRDI